MPNKQLYPHSITQTSTPRLKTIAFKPTDVTTKISWRTFQFRLLKEQVLKFYFNYILNCAHKMLIVATHVFGTMSHESRNHVSIISTAEVFHLLCCVSCIFYLRPIRLTTRCLERILFESRGIPLCYA